MMCPVLRMTALAFPTATMRSTDARGQWRGPLLRPPREVQEDGEAQEGMEIWWREEKEGKRAGVQIGWDTVQGLQEVDDGVAVTLRMTDTGTPEEDAPIVPVGHKCGESARKIRLTVHSRQGMVPGSGAGVPGAGQGEGGQGLVSRGGGDKRLEGEDRQYVDSVPGGERTQR